MSLSGTGKLEPAAAEKTGALNKINNKKTNFRHKIFIIRFIGV